MLESERQILNISKVFCLFVCWLDFFVQKNIFYFLLRDNNDNIGFDRIYFCEARWDFSNREVEREREIDTEQRNGRTLVKADPYMSHILQKS